MALRWDGKSASIHVCADATRETLHIRQRRGRGICFYVVGVFRYSSILEKIQPLEEELHEAVAALDKSQAR